MTKPADSGQIAAKAREHMREFWRKSGHDFNEADIEKLCDDAPMEIDHWAAFAASERQAVIEECCRAVCSYCRDGDVPERRMYSHPPKPFWVHTMIGFDDRTEDCNAGAIYEAAAIRSME